jgi:alpha-ketoglutarate-dependent taurine dioxygenase
MSTSNFKTEVAQLQLVRGALTEFPLVVVRGQSELDEDGLLQFARGLSSQEGEIENQLLHWEFGPIMRMRLDPNAKNYLFSNEAVPLHWDGAFYREPRYLLFHCLESEGPGGETLFTSTESIWSGFDFSRREALRKVKLKYKTEEKAHYGGEITVPLVQKHPRTGRTILRFAEEVETQLNPVELTIDSPAIPAHKVYRDLRDLAYQPTNCYRHEWKPGDVVIADNFALIHGRTALKENRLRSFNRVQIL